MALQWSWAVVDIWSFKLSSKSDPVEGKSSSMTRGGPSQELLQPAFEQWLLKKPPEPTQCPQTLGRGPGPVLPGLCCGVVA